jgi:hypothetical protein
MFTDVTEESFNLRHCDDGNSDQYLLDYKVLHRPQNFKPSLVSLCLFMQGEEWHETKHLC